MPAFKVRATPRSTRLLRSLGKQHPQLVEHYARVLRILEADPYNSSRAHPIKKLTNVSPGDGQYRVRVARFRFRYDIFGRDVVLHYCSLRREDTYG